MDDINKQDTEFPKPLKFLMVLNNIDWFWSHRLPLARAIMLKGWLLQLSTHKADKDETLKDLSVQGFDLPPHGRGSDILALFKVLTALYKTIHDQQPDIIHAITIRYAFYAGIVTRLMGYKPVVFTIAGLGNLYTAPGLKYKLLRLVILPIFRFVFGGRDRHIIFQNPDDQKKMVDAKIVPIEKTTIIRGSGVNIKEFSYTPYVEHANPPIILFASRLLKEKGIYDFIEAAIILKGRDINARFVIAGDVYPDNSRSVSKGEMEDYQKDGVIEWWGRHDDMIGLINQSMMMVLPSYYGEGVPKVLLEAAAIGRPIITCDTPGCREAVDHNANGLLVPPQSPTDLADAIEQLILAKDKRQEMGQNGRTRVENDFNTDAVVHQTMMVYDTLLQGS